MKHNVLNQLAELDNLSISELKKKWRSLFETEPPRYNRTFLVKRLAYRIQELAYGGLSDETKARMDGILKTAGCDELGRLPHKKNSSAYLPGTSFIREWRGERHEVLVLADGFEYRGRQFKSLSAIAREITGTRWNGPLFFGVRNGALANAKTGDANE